MNQHPEARVELIPLIQSLAEVVRKQKNRYLQRKHGITETQFAFLVELSRVEGGTVGTLAERLHCTRGNLTGVADRLERDGWVTRIRDTQDRRVVRIFPTELCIQELPGIYKGMSGNIARLSRVLSPEDQTALSDLLRRFFAEQEQQAG